MLLIWMIITPLIGSIICWQSEYLNKNIPKWSALFINIILLILSMIILQKINFNSKNIFINKIPKWDIEFYTTWTNKFNINIHLAIDSLSSLMIIITNILSIISILISWNNIKQKSGLFYFNIMLIITSTIGIFLSIDMILFLFFWEIISIPIYILITIWGNKNISTIKRIKNATTFFIYTQISGIILLCNIITLAYINYKNTNIWSFNYNYLLKTNIPETIENILMFGFLLSFAIKIPIIPIHKWIINTHISLPTNSTVDIIALLLKVSLYGILRFELPLFPHAINKFSTIISYLIIIGIFYSSLMALAQNNIKKLIVYNSIMHTNFILIAIYNINKLTYQGIVLYIISNILSTSSLFILCKQIYKHLNTFDMNKIGGLWKDTGLLPGITLFFILANIGLPGTSNFLGEILILLGIYKKSPIISSLMLLNLIFSSMYSLKILHKVFYGKKTNKISIKNIDYKLFSINIFLIITTLIIGLYPKIILKQI